MSQRSELTTRELHIKGLFHPKLMGDVEAEELVRRISSIGDRFGFVGNQGNDDRRKHKYDVWIANQVRRELMMDPPRNTILDREGDLFLIIDWAIATRPNLSSLSYEQAFDQQKRWIERLFNQGVVRPQPIDTQRVIYRCSNGCFLYLLKPSDLQFEGYSMGHCVGTHGGHYTKLIDNNRGFIISLRDENNMPHVTIEITLNHSPSGRVSATVLQQQGKGNKEPIEKYHEALREFVLFSNGAMTSHDADFLANRKS